ncbi:MAG: FxsA family protein [Sciscionella sp.]
MAVVFLLYLIVEVAAVVAVASAVGVLWTIVLLLAGAFLGSWLARREGRRAMQALIRTAQAGGSPHREVSDGMLIALGGVLILIPGFVSDLLGLLFLLPPTRSLMRRVVGRSMSRRGAVGYGGVRRQTVVVDGEVVDGEPTGESPGQPRQQPPVIDPS